MAGSHSAVVVVVVDLHSRVRVGHGCGSTTSSMRRGTRIWRIRHVGTQLPAICHANALNIPHIKSFLPRVQDGDESNKSSKNKEEVAVNVKEDS